jgi:branched-chain amino acid transport system substrate-binding protein
MEVSTLPIKIGYTLSLTGPLGDNGQSAQLAHHIWEKNVNRRGGLLNRPVKMICYDDQTDAALVPQLFSRLLDEDKVDLIIGGYGTNSLLPAMPLVIDRRHFFVGLMGLGVNNAFAYPGYFAMIPTGPDPNVSLTEGFFDLAAKQSPRPETVALLSADAAFSRNPILGAKVNAEKNDFRVVYEQKYPLTTNNFRPLLDGIAAAKPDLLFLCSYLSDSIGLIRAINEHNFRPKMVGAAMIGPQNTFVKKTLGPLLNGFVNYEYWVPVPKMVYPGVEQLMDTYQSMAISQGVDELGHYMAPLAYAQMQIVEQAVLATKSLDNEALIAYSRSATFETVMGQIKFGALGEWAEPRVVQVQFQNIAGHNAEQFKRADKVVVVAPEEFASGKLKYPY